MNKSGVYVARFSIFFTGQMTDGQNRLLKHPASHMHTELHPIPKSVYLHGTQLSRVLVPCSLYEWRRSGDRGLDNQL